jgi:endonuclease/exonuclease/phosphatase family metal-dependent hydrolase
MIRRWLLLLCLLTPGPLAWASDPTPTTLLTFNIRFGTANDGPNRWEARRQMVIDVLERHDADVVGLQEALGFQIAEIRGVLPGYGLVGVGRDDGRVTGEWSPILYRLDRFAVAEAGTFWLSGTPERTASATWGNSITRICTWARLVEHGTGRGVYVFNTHFDHVSQPSREESARLIAERIAGRRVDDPVVLMGDFNAGETNPAVVFLTADPDGPGLVDTFRVLHPNETEVGTFNGFRDRRDGEKIDFVLVEPRTRVLGASIDRTRAEGRSPSDHEPVAATVDLWPAGPTED